MKAVLVGGTFDAAGGRPSGLIRKFGVALGRTGHYQDSLSVVNGGDVSELSWIIDSLNQYDAIFWMPNVPNEFEKHRDLKKRYPTKMLITSKRNEQKYGFKELVSRSIELKANLTIEFYPTEDRIISRVFDPLGNVWCEYTPDIQLLADRLTQRLAFIRTVTRQHTSPSPYNLGTIEQGQRDPAFFDIVRESS